MPASRPAWRRKTSRCCPRPQTQTTGGNAWTERTVAVRKGDTVATVLRELGARPDDIKAITAVLGARGRDGGVRENHKLRVLLAPTDDPKLHAADPRRDRERQRHRGGRRLVRSRPLCASRHPQPGDRSRAVAQPQEEEEDDGRGVRLYQSIYETALRNQVPRPLIEDLIRIYSYDVDFQRRVQPGDSFEVLFAEDEGSADGKSEVLFASLTTGGETRRYYRFQSADDGLVDFYDDTGKSAKKFLVRKPLADGIMRSGFGIRHHPLLRYTKMHTGVDWAAPMGTPIYASGNGIDRKDGLGRRLRPLHPHPPRQRLPDRLRPHVGLRPQHGRRQARPAGPDHRLCRLHRPVDRRAPALRDHRQRPPRRPDEVSACRAAACSKAPTLASFEQERERLDNMITPRRPAARRATSRDAR